MTDKVTKIRKNSLLQHGHFNDRIYLMKLDEQDFPEVLKDLAALQQQYAYSKIFAKIPPFAVSGFLSEGYSLEARVPFFYDGELEGAFMAKYFSSSRRMEERWEEVEKNIRLALSKQEDEISSDLPSGMSMRPADDNDTAQMAELYRLVFKTYPFPIHDPKYLQQTMHENIKYFGVWEKDKLVALSSAEQDEKERNVEMTDFATDPECRGQGLASLLLLTMEESMAQSGYKMSYTIARAMSPGMNITFARAGYLFGGTLIKNTNIAGRFESMNVWYKRLN